MPASGSVKRRGVRGTTARSLAAQDRRAAQRAASRQIMRSGAVPMNVAVRGLQVSQGEFKSADTTWSVGVNTSSSVFLVNGIARGDEINERNGREVVMKSVQIKGYVTATSATGSPQLARVALVYDRQTNGSALTAAQVFTSVLPWQPRNLENRRRFKIMMDKYISVPSRVTGDSSGPVFVPFEFYRKLDHPITFNSGDAGTVADITTGSMYLVFMSNVASGTTDAVSEGSCRIRYQDK